MKKGLNIQNVEPLKCLQMTENFAFLQSTKPNKMISNFTKLQQQKQKKNVTNSDLTKYHKYIKYQFFQHSSKNG